ncbi:hypothetical protein M514_12124 [Trichuris suis]|uniref:ZP domain-containing protein n=1 Tax=Trichuris suis TaxID=68888 RepID=A0A085MXB9_9BILA|nr:hypothetical protein M513_12124 [Trichuris suis]KFD61865.1 hypothetical protein M514_12124 [Trichuris suis]KHJ45707.1 zona pellucida-like domain protein [Trichuris suis]
MSQVSSLTSDLHFWTCHMAVSLRSWRLVPSNGNVKAVCNEGRLVCEEETNAPAAVALICKLGHFAISAVDCSMKVAARIQWPICSFLLVLSCFAEANFIADKFAICEEQKVHFSISFSQLFRGVIYSDGHYGNPRCTYVNETSANRYDFAIPINECRTGRQENGTVQHNLIVQRDPKILSGQDQLLYIICLPTVNAQLHSSTLSPSVIHFDGVKVGLNLDSQAVRASMERNITYKAEIRRGDGYFGQPVQGELNVGEALSYVARVRGYHASNVRIGRCWASDEFSNLMLSDDNGCPMHAVKSIWSEFDKVQLDHDEVVLYNKIKAWAFPTSNRLNILCNLHFCSGHCINLCSGPTTAQPHQQSA